MPASESEVLVGRRYLERGFLDAAMKLFVRNAELVPASDWSRLAGQGKTPMFVAVDQSPELDDLDPVGRRSDGSGFRRPVGDRIWH